MGLGRGLGQCLAYPTDTRDLRRRNLVYFSGGVGCGFGFALICGMVVRFGGLHSGYLTEFLGWCFWIALSLNALSLVPDGMGSDGFCLNIMRKGGPKADQLIAAFTAQIHDLLGIRYRDMDRVLSDALTQPACTPVWQLMGQNTAYFVAMDAGRIDEARPLLEHLRELAEETPSLPNVELELAYFAAVHEKNPVEARRHYEAADGEGSPFARATAEAAILIEEGQSEAALSVLDTIQDQVTAARSSGTAMMQHAVDCFEGLNLRAGGSVSSAAVRPVTVEN